MFMIPQQKDAEALVRFPRSGRSYLASLWFMSQDAADWRRIENIRQRDSVDWNRVVDMHNKMDAAMTPRGCASSPGRTRTILRESFLPPRAGGVRSSKIRDNWLLIDEYPERGGEWTPDKTDFTLLNEHHWQGQNPVTTEDPGPDYAGRAAKYSTTAVSCTLGPLFRSARSAPGVPQDVAALVRTIEANRIVLELYT